ncbi:hypothetical protein AFIC_002325 [[Pseudomonas] carboxydohydrogena]|uniref:Uncharacterized protein n=1 Tax=Afipia carboxydohydrogena TaxID=290 RepID=A0ABY8BN07_AFICR|nr:hypothetical protein [[Pseudomonas] carboxydohydrogena]WEF50776.1 hypothetical protein AFIC_002325 [[Pseudomonas] carboxydohydrogena]
MPFQARLLMPMGRYRGTAIRSTYFDGRCSTPSLEEYSPSVKILVAGICPRALTQLYRVFMVGFLHCVLLIAVRYEKEKDIGTIQPE